MRNLRRRSASSLLAATLFAFACGESASNSHASPEPTVSTYTRFQATQSSDLGLPLLQAFSQHQAANGAQPSTFELALGPGVYQGYNLSLRDNHKPSVLSLIVRGSTDEPPRLQVPIRLAANDLTLQNLVVEGVATSSPTAEFKVGGTLEMARVAWLGNAQTDAGVDDPLILIAAAFGSGPQQVRLVDCWFLGNRVARQGAALIQGSTRQPDIFALFSVTGTVFAGNDAAVILAPTYVEQLALEGTSWWAASPTATLLRLSNPSVLATLQGGSLSGNTTPVEIRQVVGLNEADFTPVRFSGTQVLGSSAEALTSPLLDLAEAAVESAGGPAPALDAWMQAARVGEAPSAYLGTSAKSSTPH